MFERRRANKRIAASPALVADTPDGTVAHVTGIVHRLDMFLRSPTTGRGVVAFCVNVHEPSRREPGGLDLQTPGDYVDLVPFAVHQPVLGAVLIDSAFAELVVPKHVPEQVHDRSWTDFCDDRMLSPSSSGTERPLFAGTEVTVLGTVARRPVKPGTESGFRDAATQLCLVGDFDHPLLIIDAG